jgi:type III restriction enzyme
MDNQFFERPILNSPYEYPARHWELDKDGQPTQRIIEQRRRAARWWWAREARPV